MNLDDHILKAVEEKHPPASILHLFQEKHNEVISSRMVAVENLRQSLMCKAILAKHHQLVHKLLEDGFDCNAKHGYWASTNPLHLACYLGDKQFIQLFLDHQADVHLNSRVELCSSGVKSAFAFVLQHDDIDLMTLLLDKFREGQTKFTGTALHVACRENAYKCLGYLLWRFPEDVNATDSMGNTPLMFAVCKGARMVSLLLQSGADVNLKTVDNHSCLHRLFSPSAYAFPNILPRDTFDILQLLVKHGFRIKDHDDTGETPLCLLCMHVKNEIQTRLDLPFPYPVEEHRENIRKCFELLLKEGANVDSLCGRPPSVYIIDNIRMAVDVTTRWHDSLEQGAVALKSAKEVFRFSVEMLRRLFDYGAKVNAADPMGRTLLTEVLLILRLLDADQTAGWQSTKSVYKSLISLLLQNGATGNLMELTQVTIDASEVMLMVLNSLPLSDREFFTSIDVCLIAASIRPQALDHEWGRMVELLEGRKHNTCSLKHLSRLSVYVALGRKMLRDQVEKLPLPNSLMEYLLSFED